MTDISVFTQNLQVENLSWDLTPPDGGFDQEGTIDVSAFTQAQHFPNGYIPSGTVLALATTGAHSGFLVPYLNAATAGTGDVAVGILKATVTVVQLNGVVKAKVGAAFRVHGIVSKSKLPNNSTNQAAGGYLDASGQTDLPLIYFAA